MDRRALWLATFCRRYTALRRLRPFSAPRRSPTVGWRSHPCKTPREPDGSMTGASVSMVSPLMPVVRVRPTLGSCKLFAIFVSHYRAQNPRAMTISWRCRVASDLATASGLALLTSQRTAPGGTIVGCLRPDTARTGRPFRHGRASGAIVPDCFDAHGSRHRTWRPNLCRGKRWTLYSS
jgi:hypothetical protein